MENFLESLNIINFEKIDYEYIIEKKTIDINNLFLTESTNNLSGDKRQNEKDLNKKEKKNKLNKKNLSEIDLNLSKQSSNTSIFIVPTVKKNQNYDLQLSQLDKVNKSKIKSIKKNDFDKIKKILSASNISMNVNNSIKIIKEKNG